MTTIATWNVNSIRARLPHLTSWLEQASPDILGIQETKVQDHDFPFAELQDLGYHTLYCGQKSYNGVALLSKQPATLLATDIPGFADPQRRVLAAQVAGITLLNLYVPNGSEVGSEKYSYKLAWLDALAEWVAQLAARGEPLALVGDFNIAPLPTDVWDHGRMSRMVTHTPIEIAALERMKRALYFIDALREVHPAENPVFTWWSYRIADWQGANKGRRLDHMWVTPALKDRIANVDVLLDVRHWTPASDHVPVVMTLKP